MTPRDVEVRLRLLASRLRPRLPWTLLALYVIGAVGASFPDTAMTEWLQPGGLGMSQSQQVLMYATGFAMFSLKPLYGAVADCASRVAGRSEGRAAVYVVAQCAATGCHLWLGRVARSDAEAFSAYVALSASPRGGSYT